jgi:hypothetical protein
MPYIHVEIERDGMITADNGDVVHRDSRDVQHWGGVEVYGRLMDAKAQLLGEANEAILALTRDGGGDAIWMRRDQQETLVARLAKWKGCYGAWTVRFLET